MKVRGLLWLTAVLLVMAAGTRGRTAERDKPPRLKEKATLYKRGYERPSGYVAFSPDGKSLLSLSGEIKAQLWDVAGEKPIAVLRHDTYRTITAAAFSPDGKFLATGDRMGAIWIWNAETGKKFARLGTRKALARFFTVPMAKR